MSKKLPYFQFEPAQYLSGDILLCSYEAQGVFIHLISIYWQRDCQLTMLKAQRMIKSEALNELIDEDIIKLEGHNDDIIISFLDQQFEQITKQKKRLSDAGKKGAQVKKDKAKPKPPLSEAKAPLKQPDKIREDKIIEEEIIKEFDIFWDTYGKKIGKPKCLSKFSGLPAADRTAILEYIPKYVESTPDITYRKHPITFLNNRGWEDEIIPKQTDPPKQTKLDQVWPS